MTIKEVLAEKRKNNAKLENSLEKYSNTVTGLRNNFHKFSKDIKEFEIMLKINRLHENVMINTFQNNSHLTEMFFELSKISPEAKEITDEFLECNVEFKNMFVKMIEIHTEIENILAVV
ncbi:MAG: hypothetical protein LBE36_01245 [Flavobacteriaceae bacterium]|jgi:hypothetical protein|nr:hypothetical protein [Flavobacteriaceae bacterium]